MRALLLDLDGTVINTTDLIWQCYRDTFAEQHSRDLTRELFERCIGLHLSDMFALALHEHELPASGVEALVERYRERQVFMDDHLETFPGIPETLRTVRERGTRLAIVTTKYGAVARRHLGILGLLELFDVIVAGDDCEQLKPHPEPFRRALERLGVDSREAAGVGDSQHDVASARSAGLLAGAACWGTGQLGALLASGPDVVLERPEELVSLLERRR
jgi:HAD superfamily hydrolase (TIGR01549 family)